MDFLSEEWTATYDEHDRVLYLSSPNNRPARGVEMPGDIVFRFAEDNGELVGVTLLNVPEPPK